MAFDPKEIENAKIEYGRRVMIDFASPITAKENFRRALKGEQLWMPMTGDKINFTPEIVPDNTARALVTQGKPYEGPKGGEDMFGVYWEFVPSANGSMVRPGNPMLTDVSKWREVIKFPDVDSWDWEKSAREDREYLENNRKTVLFCILTGFFERLISFMDFGPAAYALMNRKTKEDVKELMDKIADLWIDVVDHVHKYYGDLVDGITIHDDWGAQDGPFFNARIVNEMLVPYMRKVTDHIHSYGYITNLHSCGKVEKLLPCMIDAGWDAWDGMAINDYHMLFEEYAGKILMNVPASECPADADAETQKEWAAKYADEFAVREKPATLSNYDNPGIDFDFELYRLSRIKFSED
ncbi:MAG: methyltransferase [Oscillospiraceae bacterium]|nr:methyltransferase [Oscillospiraceae bacterium]MBP1556033.1 methyltransferase [Oscillospiraceae bacterium]MBQ5341354.1 methyltransferase [Oscillospiraceae bacterium]MBQ5342833.1 methyltransferase [Oscillospiraceae bacterium]